MRVQRRLPITLVEILIVMVILALIGGVIGINITRALREQRFRTEVDLMVDTLRLSQDIMLVMGTDVRVKFQVSEDGEGIEYQMEVEGGVPKQWESTVKRNRRLLTQTHHVSLSPRPEGGDSLTLRFQSGGSMMSKGVFRMSTHEDLRTPGALTAAICLKGYPHPIVSVIERDRELECLDADEEEFDRRLTLTTIQEIIEDNEAAKAAGAATSGEGQNQDVQVEENQGT